MSFVCQSSNDNRPRFRRVFLLASTFLGMAAFASAQDLDGLELSDFKLRLGQDQVLQDLAQSDLRLAQAQLYPKVTVGSDWVMGGRIEYSPDVTQQPGSTYSTRDPSTVGVELTWRLFDGLKNLNTIYSARENVAATADASLDTKQKLFVERAEKMLALTRDRSILADSQRALKRQQDALYLTRQMLSDGIMTQSDAALAAAEVENLKAMTDQARMQVSDSELAFEKFSGSAAPNRIHFNVSRLRLPVSAIAASDRAMENSPLPSMALHLENAAQFKAQAAKGAYFPTVDLVAKYNRAYDPAPGITTANNYGVLLRVRLPIFDMTIKEGVGRAQAEAMQKTFDREDTILSVTSSARKYFNNYRSLKSQVSRIEARVRESKKAQDALSEEMKVGQHTIFDLIATQRNVISAEQSLAQTKYLRDMAAVNLMATMGDLDETTFSGI